MSDKSRNSTQKKVRTAYNTNINGKGLNIATGIYLGIVVNNEDTSGLGRVKVQISRLYGSFPAADLGENADPELYLGAVWVLRMLTSGGLTPVAATGGQNSYGMLGSPPSVGNTVIVVFSPDLPSGLMIGVLPTLDQNKNMAGPTASLTKDGSVSLSTETANTKTSTSEKPVKHPLAYRLELQGTERDRLRGLNFSSPTREPASRVTGVSTPGGHSISMDDGAKEDGSSRSMRLRSSAGAQILMDDTNGFTYIVNRDGTSWVEMNRNGDIDIYSKNGINMHTEGDYNLHVGGAFNLQANGINMVATDANGISMAATGGDVNIYALTNLNLQADANGNLKVAGNYRETAGRIDMNGPPALAANQPMSKSIAGNVTVTNSIAGRIPEAEPWGGHLDISVLDNASASGAANYKESVSYYNNVPSSAHGQQVGNFGTNDYPPSKSTDLLQWQAGLDPRVDPNIVKIVTEVARQFGRPLTVVSGFRTPATNKKGAKASQHLIGHALDISGQGFSNNDRIRLVSIASSLGVIGIGVYSGGSLHFDNRTGSRAGWGDDFTFRSVSSYMITTLNKHRNGGFGTKSFADGNTGYSGVGNSSSDVAANQNMVSNKVAQTKLEKDPAFQSQLSTMKAKYPGLTDQQIYNVIQGESNFDTTATNPSGATGLFQLMPRTANDVGYTTAQIQVMNPSEQLVVYDKYLAKNNYAGGKLGIMQAAPAFANRSGNTIVYKQGSAAWRQNKGWRDTSGQITVNSINAYYGY